jgi:hypothetical protein
MRFSKNWTSFSRAQFGFQNFEIVAGWRELRSNFLISVASHTSYYRPKHQIGVSELWCKVHTWERCCRPKHQSSASIPGHLQAFTTVILSASSPEREVPAFFFLFAGEKYLHSHKSHSSCWVNRYSQKRADDITSTIPDDDLPLIKTRWWSPSQCPNWEFKTHVTENKTGRDSTKHSSGQWSWFQRAKPNTATHT